MNKKNDVNESAIYSVCPRLENESARAYEAFTDFLFYNCSIIELARIYNSESDVKPPSKSVSTLNTWCASFKWNHRREKWYNYKMKLREDSMLAHWESHRDRVIKNSASLVDKAEQMLRHPLIKSSVDKDDGTTVIIEPARWSFRDVATFLDVSTKLTKEVVGDENWAKEFLKRKGYQVLEPGIGDIAMALNSLVEANIIPSNIVPEIIDAITESEINMAKKIQKAFDLVEEEKYFIESDTPDLDEDLTGKEEYNNETTNGIQLSIDFSNFTYWE